MYEGCKGPPKNSFSSPPNCLIVCQPNKHPSTSQVFSIQLFGPVLSSYHNRPIKNSRAQRLHKTAHSNVFANRKYIESNSLADALAARWWLQAEGRRRKQRRKVERDTLAALALSVVMRMAHPSVRTERL